RKPPRQVVSWREKKKKRDPSRPAVLNHTARTGGVGSAIAQSWNERLACLPRKIATEEVRRKSYGLPGKNVTRKGDVGSEPVPNPVYSKRTNAKEVLLSTF